MASVPVLDAASSNARNTVMPYDGSDDLYEIVNGERRELPPMGAYQNVLASTLHEFMAPVARRNRLGIVVTETLFALSAEPRLQRRPDVAFVSNAHWTTPLSHDAAAWEVIPDLAVEIVSPTNLADEIDEKITDYFAHGVRMVWVIYPRSGRIYVYESPKQVRGLDQSDELDGGNVLPGFRLRIADWYAAVMRPD